ncbi:MAG: tetratricopeptide repeat protein [Deltaproteobacteria bacterium]|nr:tetratricopeptide repeat protein [Deltaproteobacteria bacterium]
MNTLLSVRDVAKLFGLKESRLRYWAQTGFVNPSGKEEGKRLYTFNDLVAVKAAKELLDAGIPLQRVRRNLQALHKKMPQARNPLGMLRIRSNGDELMVVEGEAAHEPTSGQLLLDFEVGELSETVAEVLQLRRTEPKTTGQETRVSVSKEPPTQDDDDPALRSAYGWFSRGCALDADPKEESAAIDAYEKALELDPSLAAAQTNLGNIHYRQGRAQAALRCYQGAIALNPEQPEALYNLANIYEEEGDLDMAIAEYRRALKILPDFADAHFNIALTLEEVGGKKQAFKHWQRYLDLTNEENDKSWREVAQSHLHGLLPAQSQPRMV